jgi:hypothetical protein
MPEPLRSYLTVQTSYDRRVRGILERTAHDLGRRIRILDVTPGVGSRVRAAQLRLVLVNLEQAMVGQLGSVIATGVTDAAEAAVKAASVIDDVLYRTIGGGGAEVLMRSSQATARRGMVVNSGRYRRELSSRVYSNYRNVAGLIEETIQSGLISGLAPRELARSVYQFVSPTTPGGASYASMRLSRTEINNAFHQQQIKSAQKPWVEWAVWNLSGSHKHPDQCNVYASQRTFRSDQVPDKPHPQCLCYLTYDTVSRDEFINNFLNGHYDDFLDDTVGKTVTQQAHQLGTRRSITRRKAR